MKSKPLAPDRSRHRTLGIARQIADSKYHQLRALRSALAVWPGLRRARR